MDSLLIALGIIGLVGIFVSINAWRREILFKRMVLDFKDWVEPFQRRLTDVNRFLLNEEILRTGFSEYPRSLVDRLWRDVVKDNYTDIDPMDGERCLRRK